MSNEKFLAEIIIDPASAKSLLYDKTQNVLHTDDFEKTYKISEDVPVILQKEIFICHICVTPKFKNQF